MKKTFLLSVLLVLVASVPAAAAGKARIYSSTGGGSFLVEPEKLKYTPDEFGGSQTYALKQLEWDDWGKAKVEGTGVLKSCVDGGDCFTVDATLKASHPLKND